MNQLRVKSKFIKDFENCMDMETMDYYAFEINKTNKLYTFGSDFAYKTGLSILSNLEKIYIKEENT